MTATLRLNEHYAAGNGQGHRIRRDSSRARDHVAISFEEYTHVVKRCLRAGFTINFSTDGSPALSVVLPTEECDWGFSAATLHRRHAILIGRSKNSSIYCHMVAGTNRKTRSQCPGLRDIVIASLNTGTCLRQVSKRKLTGNGFGVLGRMYKPFSLG